MASGSRGFKDFGLSTNLTLPISNGSSIEPDPKVMAQNAFMPEERDQKSKKHARFAPEQDDAKVQRKPSWFRRLFRRGKKNERSAPYVTTTREEEDDEALVRVVRSGSDPELSAEHEGQVQRRNQAQRSDRQTKARSTAFEHITTAAEKDPPIVVEVIFKHPTSGESALLVLCTHSSSYLNTGSQKVVLQCKADSKDGLGLNISDRTPPLMVIRVKPGGKADLAGIKEGDTILEINGVSCRRKLEASLIRTLKALIQPAEDKPPEKIKKLDSSGSDEGAASPEPAEVKPKKAKKKRLASSRALGSEYGDPLAASSPVKEKSFDNDAKPKKKKKRSSINGGEEAAGNDSKQTNDDGKAKRSSRKAASPSTSAATDEQDKASPKKKKKKKTTNGAEASQIETSTRSPAKSEVSKKSLSSKTSSPDVKTVKAEINDLRIDDSYIAPQNGSLSVDEVDGSFNVDRSDRHRRSSSPKSRYRMEESESPAEEQEQPEKVTVGVITKEKEPQKIKKKGKASEKKKKKKSKEEPKEKPPSRKVSKEESSSHKESKEKPPSRKVSKEKPPSRKVSKEKPPSRKVSKEKPPSRKVSKEQPPSRKVSAAAKEQPIIEEVEPVSAAISGSIESNTLTFVSKEDRYKHGEANTLPRSKSAGHNRSAHSSAEVSVNHSTSSSISNLREGTEKKFREELREASRSQHDMPEAINSSLTVEIDPNIKVKKSGLVKGKQSVTSRPSIFDQSSSPEPEDMTPISSGAVEDNILDSELKVKKSGLMVGRKTSATSRPSILDEKQTETQPSDIEPGEMKYNRKLSKGVDLSSVPEIAPTLGLVAGRDRRDASNRSLNKRRPASQRESLLLDSKENEIMGTQRVDLSQIKDNKADEKGAGRWTAARNLYENNGQHQDTGQHHIPKLSPVKARLPADGSEDNKGTPSWIAIAQGRQKKGSFVEKEATTKPVPAKTTPAPSAAPVTSDSKGSSVPLGHVAQRLAMFQKH